MNWNPFKRIAELEALHTKNVNVLSALTDKLNQLEFKVQAQARWLAHLETRLQDSSPVTISRADVEKEAKSRIKRAAYARKYYAKKRAEKAAGGKK